MIDFKLFENKEGNVFKYVFEGNDYIAETVLYRYENFYKRTVICCSTMCGCPVGCSFCGTGKKFIRNLTADEIVDQIQTVLLSQNISDINEKGERFQIMFMSMGEPMLNWNAVSESIIYLNQQYPNADLLISTVAPITEGNEYEDMTYLSQRIKKIGLQFSIHKSNNQDRNKIIPYKNKMTLEQIRDVGLLWWQKTNRKPFLNYCIDGTNCTEEDAERLFKLFPPSVFCFTFSVICSKNETLKNNCFRDMNMIQSFEMLFIEKGYNTRIFDPAGQDDIGGGCGQLWYVQKWMKEQQ